MEEVTESAGYFEPAPDPQERLLHDFSQTIKAINRGEVPFCWLADKYIDVELISNGDDPREFLQSGVYLNPLYAEELPVSATRENLQVKFEQKYGLGVGATQSRHNVFFGDAALLDTNGQPILSGEVAIKPFLNNPAAAFYEYGFNCLMLSKGFDAFTPAAVINESDKAYLVTVFDPSITTIDNLDWGQAHESREYTEELLPVLKIAAQGLGLLHARRIRHGDAKVRNMAIAEDQSFRVIDMEWSSYISNPTAFAEVYLNVICDDLLNFYTSIRDAGFLKTEQPETIFNSFNDHFLEHYKAQVLTTLDGVDPELVRKAFDEFEGEFLGFLLLEDSFDGEI